MDGVRRTVFNGGTIDSGVRNGYGQTCCAVQLVSVRDFSVAGILYREKFVSSEKLNDYAVKVFCPRAYDNVFGRSVYASGTVEIIRYCRFKLFVAVAGNAL